MNESGFVHETDGYIEPEVIYDIQSMREYPVLLQLLKPLQDRGLGIVFFIDGGPFPAIGSIQQKVRMGTCCVINKYSCIELDIDNNKMTLEIPGRSPQYSESEYRNIPIDADVFAEYLDKYFI
ncbi:MAG: hypothetical protein M0P49_01085 [Bacilli bacterium]|nr:hypothetical protein [Bacilli bacterium]